MPAADHSAAVGTDFDGWLPAGLSSGGRPYAGFMTAPPTTARTAIWPVLLGVAALAGVTAAAIGAMSLAEALTATGLPDPGPVTNYGLPFVRAAGEVVEVVAVGSFLFAAFFVPPQDNGVLDAAGYRALRIGTFASGAWACLRGAAGAADDL